MRFLYWLLDLIFPRKCSLCGKLLRKDETDYCHGCRVNSPYFPVLEEKVHPSGKTELRFLDSFTAVWYYKGNVRKAILRLKFQGARFLAVPLGRSLAMKVLVTHPAGFDFLTWVPVSRKRLKRRGYDQSRLLAEAACRRWDTRPVRLLTKIQDNPAQSGLRNEAARRVNVLGVYDPAESETIRGRRILLIDDICTTGATLRECVRVLLDNGASAVLCLTVAKTPNNEKKEKNSQIVSCNQGNTQV